eukprot:UN01119
MGFSNIYQLLQAGTQMLSNYLVHFFSFRLDFRILSQQSISVDQNFHMTKNPRLLSYTRVTLIFHILRGFLIYLHFSDLCMEPGFSKNHLQI